VKYSDLQVWQKAMELVAEIYRLSKLLPADERFGLVSQMQRASVSVPANIAEGHGRKATRAYMNHLSIANGSLMELETLVQIAARLDYLESNEVDEILLRTAELGRMLNGLKASLSRS
jgi:four helix bundle protein